MDDHVFNTPEETLVLASYNVRSNKGVTQNGILVDMAKCIPNISVADGASGIDSAILRNYSLNLTYTPESHSHECNAWSIS